MYYYYIYVCVCAFLQLFICESMRIHIYALVHVFIYTFLYLFMHLFMHESRKSSQLIRLD